MHRRELIEVAAGDTPGTGSLVLRAFSPIFPFVPRSSILLIIARRFSRIDFSNPSDADFFDSRSLGCTSKRLLLTRIKSSYRFKGAIKFEHPSGPQLRDLPSGRGDSEDSNGQIEKNAKPCEGLIATRVPGTLGYRGASKNRSVAELREKRTAV